MKTNSFLNLFEINFKPNTNKKSEALSQNNRATFYMLGGVYSIIL
jgi:hypothetical protein